MSINSVEPTAARFAASGGSPQTIGDMKTLVAIAFLATASIGFAAATQDVMQSIAESHIEGNVPPKEEFAKFLARDLGDYLSKQTGRKIELHYELLRDGPTQTGIAYPKFYVWVRGIAEDKKVVTEGAARLAAVEKSKFDVTHYISKEAIVADPKVLETIFPQALLPKIREKAGLKR